MASVNDIILRLRVDDKGVDVTLDEFSDKLKEVDRQGTKSGKSIGDVFGSIKAGYFAAAAALTGVLGGLNQAINKASDFQEASSKYLTVFSTVQDEAKAARDALAEYGNMSLLAATQALSATGDILTGLGMQQDAALELSTQTNTLAADLASFTNAQGGAEAVAHALTSAYVGEREALKTYGVVITEADVQQKLFEKGMDKLTGTALKQAKAQVTLELAMQQSKNAIGDLERTSDSYANTQRRMGAAIEDASVKFGAIFLPIATKVLEWGAKLINMIDIEQVSAALFATFQVFKDFGSRIIDLFQGIGKIIAGVVTLDTSLISEGWEQAADGISRSWSKTFMDIGQAAQEGERAVTEFMEGSAAVAGQTAAQMQQAEDGKTKQQLAEIEKRREAQQKYQDYQFETGRISLEEYKAHLDERIEHAREEYGEESLAYLEALDFKRDAEAEYLEEIKEREEQEREKKLEEREMFYEYEVARTEFLLSQNRGRTTDVINALNNQLAFARKTYGQESLIVQKLEAKKRALRQQSFDHFLGGMAQLMNAYKGQSRALFNIGKAAAIAQAVVNTAEGVTKAISKYPPPFSGLMAAVQLALGAAQIQTIKSTSFRRGGFTGRGADDEEAGTVHRNEFVANANQVRRFPGLFNVLDADRRGVKIPGVNTATETGPQIVQRIVNQENTSSRMMDELRQLRDTISGLSLKADIDDQRMALLVENGNKKLALREI